MKFALTVIITTLSISNQVSGFVLLSGPTKARLGVTASEPEVTFYWDGNSPQLTDLDELQNGIWSNLSDQEATQEIILLAASTWSRVPGSYIQIKILMDNSITADSSDYKHSISLKNQTIT